MIYPLHHEVFKDPHKLDRDIHIINPDYIYHLASYGNMIDQQDDAEIIQANVINTYTLLNFTKDIDYKAFINVSSSSVGLFHDTIYSTTKLAGEKIAKIFSERFRKPIVTARPFTICGIGDNEKHLIPTLFRSCLQKEHIKFVPAPVHDYISVDDVVQALILIADNARELCGKSIDVGTGLEYTNKEVLDIIENGTRKMANIEIVEDLRDYDTDNWHADATILKSLGWKQTETLKDSLYKIYVHTKHRS
jgi:nucleoside-diphosphate-sugar epimerase